MNLQEIIESAFADSDAINPAELDDALAIFTEALNCGEVRAAQLENGSWRVNSWVKKGILLLFRRGKVTEMAINENFRFFDKHNLPLKPFGEQPDVRIVPGGSSVRTGSFLGSGVIMMPPSYVNIGAFVDANSLIDSHVLVGSCAQIGKNVHLSAGAQIGGVLEPVGSLPVIVEDGAIIGGNCGVFEGTFIGSGAVIGAGVQLTRSTPVYDCVHGTIIRANAEKALQIPPNAVVVPGSRPIQSAFGREHRLNVVTLLIIKYRDEKTDLATLLEEALR